MDKIIEVVEQLTGITRDEMLSRSRKHDLVEARSVFAYAASSVGFSASAIGRYLLRDHTTVLNLIKRAKDNKKTVDLVMRCTRMIPKRNEVRTPMTNRGRVMQYRHVYIAYGGKCAVCSHSSVVEVCHIQAKCLGGSDELENLVLLCPTHHSMFDKGLIFIKDINSPLGFPLS